MKKILRAFGAAMSALFLCPVIYAAAGGQLIYDSDLPIPAPAAYSSTFSIRADGIDWASAQVVLTSATQANQSFNDGRASTASFTVVSFAALSTAPATGSITVASNSGAVGACVSGGGPNVGSFNVCNPGQWAVGNVSSNTACNIAAAIQATGVLLSTCGVSGASVVSTTATYPASIFNQFQIASSTQAALTVGNLISSSVVTGVGVGGMTGGQDNATLTVNGVTLTANKDYFPVTSNAATAAAIVAAWNASAGSQSVTMGGGGTVVGATTTAVGSGTMYATFTSSQGALTLSPFTSSGPVAAAGSMFGGANSSYTINGSVIQLLPTENLGLAEGVFLTTTSGNTSLTPLVYNTTYFVIPGPSGTGQIQLALTSTGAVAGIPIVLTSSQAKATSDVFQLNVPAIAGTPSVQWMASNDNLNWLPYTTTPFNIAIPSMTFSSYVATGTVTNFDFGHYNYSYLGLKVIAPTAGAVNLRAHIVGNAP